jgi:hypothetical protein
MRKLVTATAVTLITLVLGVAVAFAAAGTRTRTARAHGAPTATTGKHKHKHHSAKHKHKHHSAKHKHKHHSAKHKHKHKHHKRSHKHHSAKHKHKRSHKHHTAKHKHHKRKHRHHHTAASTPAPAPSTPTAPTTTTPAASGYTGTCNKTISPGTNPGSAESSMSAGQVLCLNSGVYGSVTQSGPNTFNASGTAAKPIVVTSGPGQTATIQGADYINGAYVTVEHLNLDEADTLYTNNGGSNPAPCPVPLSQGMELNGSGDQLLDNNVYESAYRGILIGIGYGSAAPAGVVIHNNNLGPAGGCSDSQHIIYADHGSGLQVTGNWIFDDPYGFGVQLYESPSNSNISGNVFDNVLDATVEASSQGGNVTQHNVSINSATVPGWKFSGAFTNCYTGAGDTIENNAIYNDPGGFGTCPSGVTLTGTNPILPINPFVGTSLNSDAYQLAANAAAAQVAGYGLWNGLGPPSPNPALWYPADPPNTDLVGGVSVPTG